MLCGVQGLLSVVVENHPVVQSAQLAEADVYAWPKGQGHVSAAQSVLYVVLETNNALMLAQESAILRLLHVVTDVTAKKVSVMSVTLAIFHKPTPVPVNFDASRNVFFMSVTLATFHLLRSEFISLALKNVSARVVTEVVSQKAKPVPANLDASRNVQSIFLTLSTFHALRSEFISLAPEKV